MIMLLVLWTFLPPKSPALMCVVRSPPKLMYNGYWSMGALRDRCHNIFVSIYLVFSQIRVSFRVRAYNEGLGLGLCKCTYNVRTCTLYVHARTSGFGADNIRNESFLDARVRTYKAVRTLYVRSNTKTESEKFLNYILGNSKVNLT